MPLIRASISPHSVRHAPHKMQGVQGPLLRAQTRSARQPRLLLSARAMASAPSNGDKSWAELAGDALNVAKGAFNKASKGVSDALSRVLPRDKQARTRDSGKRSEEDYWLDRGRRTGRRDEDLSRAFGGSPLDGIFGRAAGSMLGGMFGQLNDMMAESSRDAADAKQRVLSMIEGDQQVRSALGESVSILPGMDSQSTSTSVTNGRTAKQTSLGFLVTGSSGRTATAQATLVSKADGSEDVRVSVQLDDGRLIRISGDGSGSRPTRGGPRGGGGAPIDVDWREVK